METASLESVLRAARNLPHQARTELLATLLSEAGWPVMKTKGRRRPSLETLSGMSVDELKALSDAILAPSRQKRLHKLLRKNAERSLSEEENKELDEILEECDRLALLKAKAQYTLLISTQDKDRA